MRLKLLGLLLSFAGVLYWQDAKSDDAMDKYISDYKKFQAQADSASRFADSLAVEINIAENEARAAEGRASIYKKQVVETRNETMSMVSRAQELSETITDTLELARAILPLKDSIITKQETTISTQDKQISELESALKSKDTAIALLTLSRDSLQTVVKNIPPAPKNPNRMFGFKLPSRKTTFVVGVVAGVVLGGVVLK